MRSARPARRSSSRWANRSGSPTSPRQLLEQSGTPVRIEYTGLRDGEKLHEELVGDSEPRDIRPEHPLVSHVPVPPLTDIEVAGLPTAGDGRLVKAAMAAACDVALEPQVRLVETPPSTTLQLS